MRQCQCQQTRQPSAEECCDSVGCHESWCSGQLPPAGTLFQHWNKVKFIAGPKGFQEHWKMVFCKLRFSWKKETKKIHFYYSDCAVALNSSSVKMAVIAGEGAKWRGVLPAESCTPGSAPAASSARIMSPRPSWSWSDKHFYISWDICFVITWTWIYILAWCMIFSFIFFFIIYYLLIYQLLQGRGNLKMTYLCGHM